MRIADDVISTKPLELYFVLQRYGLQCVTERILGDSIHAHRPAWGVSVDAAFMESDFMHRSHARHLLDSGFAQFFQECNMLRQILKVRIRIVCQKPSRQARCNTTSGSPKYRIRISIEKMSPGTQ